MNIKRLAQQRLSIAVAILALTGMNCPAATHYVVPPGTPGAAPTNPYTNWTTAGTSIIDVVEAANTNAAPRVVWVTNGNYGMTNQIVVSNSMTIQSVNGPAFTSLNGDKEHYTNRCIYFKNPGGGVSGTYEFDGFAVTNFNAVDSNGTLYAYNAASVTIRNCWIMSNMCLKVDASSTYGGGYYQYRGSCIITNCVFSNNYAYYGGGGIYLNNFGAAYSARIEGCLLEGNYCTRYSGGAMLMIASTCNNITISNCVIVSNTASDQGGGICLSGTNNSILNCTIRGNVVHHQGSTADSGCGGGVYIGGGPTMVKDCFIINNIATNSAGGIYAAITVPAGTAIRNCLITGNRASTNIAGGVYISTGLVENCTIASNYAGVSGGGVYIGSLTATGTNNIIYHNTAASAANFTNTAGNTGLYYSCVFPAVDGVGNITNDPALLDLNAGNYRLRGGSRCINAGTNQIWMENAVDLDGKTRIRYIRVDIGCYEYVLPATITMFVVH